MEDDSALDHMCGSIREFGFKIPVIPCDEWTPAQVKAFRVVERHGVRVLVAWIAIERDKANLRRRDPGVTDCVAVSLKARQRVLKLGRSDFYLPQKTYKLPLAFVSWP
jgi:hypothetical protein